MRDTIIARRHCRALIGLLAVAPFLFACAAAQPGSAPAAPPSREQAALMRLLSDAVLVLPVHEVTVESSSGTTPQDTLAVLRERFDTAFRDELASHVTGTWTWPADLRALHRRNPVHVPDPARLSTRGLRGARLAPEQIVEAELGSEIRALLAVAGARRYVLLPLRLHVGPASHGGYAGGVSLVVIDARRAMILQVRPVATGTAGRDVEPAGAIPVDAALKHLARLARLQFTAADD